MRPNGKPTPTAATTRGRWGYALVLLVYGGLVAAVTVAAAATGRRLPQRWAAGDLLTVTLGAHKLSRTLTRTR